MRLLSFLSESVVLGSRGFWLGLGFFFWGGGGRKGLVWESFGILNLSSGLLAWCTMLAFGVIIKHEYYIMRLLYRGLWVSLANVAHRISM